MFVTVQAGIRCFIVDNAPSHQQETANAWASRLTGIGNILGYILGYLDLPKYFPFLGGNQFQVFCALASVSLCATLSISCLYIQERDPRLDGPPDVRDTGIVMFFRQVVKSVRHLPPQIAKVCEVQLAAWVGWFPFLFYSTTYIGQLYVNPIFEEHRDLSDEEINEVWELATRVGTFALLVYAVISFVANITLPALVVPTYKKVAVSDPSTLDGLPDDESNPTARRTSQSSAASSERELAASKGLEDNEGSSWLAKLQIPGLTLRRTWILSHILFAICMFSTFFIDTYQAGTVVIGIVGICWALTLWAPFALISAEVARIDAERRVRRHHSGAAEATRQRSTPDDDLEEGVDPRDTKDTENGENLAQAGIILGLHNVAVSAPQILSSLICSGIFKVAQKPRGEPWDDSVGWVLRFGGCAALIAGWLATRLGKGTRGVPV
jgi:solute carrier family 45 protein 1/2/4